MLIIYNKTTGQVVSNQGTNSLFPLGVENIQNILNYVVDQYGGNSSDYDSARLHDIEDADIVSKTFTHEYTVQNDEIVFGVEKVFPEPEPQQPSETELLTDYIVDVDYRVTMIELGL